MLKVKALTKILLVICALVSAFGSDQLARVQMTTDALGRVVFTREVPRADGATEVLVSILETGTEATLAFRALGSLEVAGLAVDADGRILIAGPYSGQLILGDQMLVSAGREDAFVLVLDTDGTPVALQGIGGAGSERAMAIGLDIYGDFQITGLSLDGAEALVFTATIGVDGTVDALMVSPVTLPESIAIDANEGELIMNGFDASTGGDDEPDDPNGVPGSGSGTPGTTGGSMTAEPGRNPRTDTEPRVIEPISLAPVRDNPDLRVERR